MSHKYLRTLNLSVLLEQKSHFLFGARATGKSSLILEQLEDKALIIDLLASKTYRRLSKNPEDLESLIDLNNSELVVIDEIQKIPELLDEVHRLIEKKKVRFLLTGSSARKLKSPGVNLLAGRAWKAEMFPLTTRELKDDFDLDKSLLHGMLPSIYCSDFPEKELEAYTGTYLKEEIQLEAQIRNLPAFSLFLETAASSNGELINFSKIARDVELSPPTVREYYRILEDSLLGFHLLPWKKNKSRKTVSKAKFYFLDTGIANHLAGITQLDPKSDLYGNAFEHFIIMEIRAANSYLGANLDINFWQSKKGDEVDLIIGNKFAFEIKSTSSVQSKHLKSLKIFQKEIPNLNYYLISQDKTEMKKEDISFLHYEDFLDRLWKGEFFEGIL